VINGNIAVDMRTLVTIGCVLYHMPRISYFVPSSFHVHHTPDAIAGSHRTEAVIDLIESLPMCDEFINLQLAIRVILHQATHL
jgi:hypothetical protein